LAKKGLDYVRSRDSVHQWGVHDAGQWVSEEVIVRSTFHA